MKRSQPERGTLVTLDFHVTSECSQECPYCWGPRDIKGMSARRARRVIAHARRLGVRRIVFTGGDPLQRPRVGELIRYAKRIGLEVALSTTGDRLTRRFLRACGVAIDLISLPLDGSCEAINALTKQPGHFAAIIRALDLLAGFPRIDVKLCTPVTRTNLRDVPHIATLVDRWARGVRNRVFYNVFQTFPRAMVHVDWRRWLVSDAEFAALKRGVGRTRRKVKINFLTTKTLDRLYAMVFPDGRLVVPHGPIYASFGQFLDVTDLDALLARSEFDARGHLRHSGGWQKTA